MLNKLVLSFEKSEHFPVFIDYDFQSYRCRGYSLKIDFMYRGLLTDFVKTVKHNNGFVFVRKEPLLFLKGFFLFDFVQLRQDIDFFLLLINKTSFAQIIMESSKILDNSVYGKINEKINLSLLELV